MLFLEALTVSQLQFPSTCWGSDSASYVLLYLLPSRPVSSPLEELTSISSLVSFLQSLLHSCISYLRKMRPSFRFAAQKMKPKCHLLFLLLSHPLQPQSPVTYSLLIFQIFVFSHDPLCLDLSLSHQCLLSKWPTAPELVSLLNSSIHSPSHFAH